MQAGSLCKPLSRERQRHPKPTHRVGHQHGQVQQRGLGPAVQEQGAHQCHRVGQRQHVGQPAHGIWQLLAGVEPLPPVRFHVLLGQKSPFVQRMPDINRAITTLQKNGTLDRLYQKYTRID